VQPRADPVGASAQGGKTYKALELEMAQFGLTDAQCFTAKALCKLTKVPPKAACLLSLRFKSLGHLMVFFRTTPRASAVAEIAQMKKRCGSMRSVGPVVAEHLHRFFTTDNGSEPYLQKGESE
jgi:hypothetical protein